MSQMSSIINSKLSNNLRETQEKRAQERRRNILYLIQNYLQENCLENTAEALSKEANLLESVEVCDNVDLDTILQEYQSFYYAKFGKYPKICKTKTDVEKKKRNIKKQSQKIEVKSKVEETSPAGDEFEIIVRQLGQVSQEEIPDTSTVVESNLDIPEDWKNLYSSISKEVVSQDLGIQWKNCIGLEEPINVLKEAVIYPLIYPEMFQDVNPWSGILLYGPPGTGKTLLAKALSSESSLNRVTTLNVTPSTFISKWRGESEKSIKVLFNLAKQNTPTIIFVDELDALASRREEAQHEASRRFKSELLTQMDGICTQNHQVLVLATSNLPWEIDPAILRRFELKVFVDLPIWKARCEIIRHYSKAKLPTSDLERFAFETEGFSGSDLRLVCKAAFMKAVRRKVKEIKNNDMRKCDQRCESTVDDLQFAFYEAKPSTIHMRDKYVEWKTKFGGV